MSSPPPSSTLAIVFSTGILCLVSGFFIGQGSALGLFSFKSKSWPNSYDVTVHPDSSDEELMEHLRRGRGQVKKGSSSAVVRGGDEGSGRSSSTSSRGSTEGEEVEVEEKDEGLKAFEDSYDEEFKLVLVVRTDIGMTKGTLNIFTFLFSPSALLAWHAPLFLSSRPRSLTNCFWSISGKIAAQCAHATLQNYKALFRSPSSASILSRWEAGGQAKIALQTGGGEQELALLSHAARREGLCALAVRDAGRTQVAGGTKTVLGVGPGPKTVVNRVTGGLKLL